MPELNLEKIKRLVAEAERLSAERETQGRVFTEEAEMAYGPETILTHVGLSLKDRVLVTFNQHFDCNGDSAYLIAVWNNYADLARAVRVLDKALCIAAGTISTMQAFDGLHPEEVFRNYIVEAEKEYQETK